jgi:hypothetical protein
MKGIRLCARKPMNEASPSSRADEESIQLSMAKAGMETGAVNDAAQSGSDRLAAGPF